MHFSTHVTGKSLNCEFLHQMLSVHLFYHIWLIHIFRFEKSVKEDIMHFLVASALKLSAYGKVGNLLDFTSSSRSLLSYCENPWSRIYSYVVI